MDQLDVCFDGDFVFLLTKRKNGHSSTYKGEEQAVIITDNFAGIQQESARTLISVMRLFYEDFSYTFLRHFSKLEKAL